jgi:hypothetical protein
MKLRLLTLLAALLLCAPSHAQTIKSLGYNTTNGQVVANTGTNVLTFTNLVAFESIRVGGDAIIDAGGAVLWGTNLLVELETFTINQAPEFEGTAAAITRTNLGLGATWLTNTNVTNFRTAIGLGATNYPAFVGIEITGQGEMQLNGASIDAVGYGGILDFEQQLVAQDNQTVFSWDTNGFAVIPAATFATNVSIAGSLSVGSFTTTNADTTRTNLGLGLAALTNTSNADMLAALGAAQTIFTVKTNDQTIIDETNATTITDLTFATEPGARYVVAFVPIIEGAASFTAMTVNASNCTVFGNWNAPTTLFAGTTAITNEFSFAITIPRSPFQTFYVEGGTNAGSISVTFRSTVATNTNTIKAGSFLRADRMP